VCTNAVIVLLFASAAIAEMIAQEDGAQEPYTHEVTVKADPDYEEDKCVYEFVHPVKMDNTFSVSDSDTVEDTHLSNDSNIRNKLVDKSLTNTKMVSTRSSPRLRAQKNKKNLQPGIGGFEVSSTVSKQTPSKLNFRPLRPKTGSVAADIINPTRTPTAAKTPQPRGSKSKSTITVLQPYEPSKSMASVGSMRYIRDILSSHKSRKEATASVPTIPPGKVPISRFKSPASSKGQIQPLTTPTQLQANLLPTGNMEQLQAFLSSLIGSGQLQTLITSAGSLPKIEQMSSKTEIQAKEEAVADTVTHPKHDSLVTSSNHSIKPEQGLISSVMGTHGAFTPSEVATRQKEQQLFNPAQIEMSLPASHNPKPDTTNPYGQLQVDLSSSVTGDLGQLQIPVPTSSVGQIHTVPIPYAVGTSNSNFQAVLPPFQTVLPSAAAGSPVFQFQPVIAPVSSGQINTLVPTSGTQIQLQTIIPSSGMFNVVSRPTSD
jgi:hypothetical protein